MAFGKKSASVAKPGLFDAIGGIVKAVQSIDPAQAIGMAQEALAELKRHNEMQAQILNRLSAIETTLAIVPAMETQLDALENEVRLAVPAIEAALTERDVLIAQFQQGAEPVQTGDDGNGIFRQIAPRPQDGFATFEAARAHVQAVQTGELKQ